MDRGTLRHGNITRALIQGLSAWGQLILVVVAWLHGWAESGDPRCGGGVRDETSAGSFRPRLSVLLGHHSRESRDGYYGQGT